VVARLVVDSGRRDAAVGAVVRAGGRVIDAVDGSLIVEFTTEPARIEPLLATLRPFGLSELARSGPVAMRRTPAS
jgi:acetolactate synthase small subunit